MNEQEKRANDELIADLKAQHAETLRLLAAAEHYVPGNAVTADWQTKPLDECRLLDKIRAHLATHSKPSAHQQTAQAVGGGK